MAIKNSNKVGLRDRQPYEQHDSLEGKQLQIVF
jgi:hypothetical protein